MEEGKMLIDGDVSNLEAKSKQTETPVPAMEMSYCCPGIGTAVDAYAASVEKSKKVRNGLAKEERPNTDSLYFGKV
jgi:hypothetical protein